MLTKITENTYTNDTSNASAYSLNGITNESAGSDALAKSLLGNNYKKVDLTANGLLNSSNLGAIRETAESNISTNSTTNSTTKALYTFQSDTIGNITKVGDVVDLNWNGRRLESIIQSGTEVLSYEYNVDGQRVSKTFIDPETNTTYTTEYFYNGSILAGQKRGNDVLVLKTGDGSLS